MGVPPDGGMSPTDVRPAGVIGRPVGRRFRVDSTTTNNCHDSITQAASSREHGRSTRATGWNWPALFFKFPVPRMGTNETMKPFRCWTLQESVRRHETIQFREPVLAHLDLRLSARCPGCWFSRSDTNETRPAGDHCDFSYGGKPLALICEAGLMLQVMRPMPRAADENLSRHRGRKNRR